MKSNSALLKSLPSSPDDFSSIHFLDISRNFLGPNGIKPLLPVIGCCTSLSALDFSSQQLHRDSVELLCATLRTHPSVVRINLSGNPLNITAGVVLLDFCRVNENIEELVLYNTQINGTMLSAIEEQTRINRSKKKSLKEPKTLFPSAERFASDSASGSPQRMINFDIDQKMPEVVVEGGAPSNQMTTLASSRESRNEVRKEEKLKFPVMHLFTEGKKVGEQEMPRKRISPVVFKNALLKADSNVSQGSAPPSSLFSSSFSHRFFFRFNPVPVLNEVCDNAKHFFYDFQFPADDKDTHKLDNHIYECKGFKRLTEIYPNAYLFPEEKNEDAPIDLPEDIHPGFQWLFTCIGVSVRTLRELKSLFLFSSPSVSPRLLSSSSTPFPADFPHAIREDEEEETCLPPSKRSPELIHLAKMSGVVLSKHEEKDGDSLLEGNGTADSVMTHVSMKEPPDDLFLLRNGVFGMRLFIDGVWKYVFADDFVPVDALGAPLFTKPHLTCVPLRTETASMRDGWRGLHRPADSETSSAYGNGSGGVGNSPVLKSSDRGSTTSIVSGSRCSSRMARSTSKVSGEHGEFSAKVYLWPCLLEKLFAKMLGGYNALDANLQFSTDSPLYRHCSRDPMYEEIKSTCGVTIPRPTSCGKVLSYLTGGVSITRQLHRSEFDADAWWKNFEALLGADPPGMAVAMSRSSSKCLSGIDPSWAYEVCQARQVNGFRLVELRCQDSCSSWHGSWSEESSEWDLFPSVEAILRRGQASPTLQQQQQRPPTLLPRELLSQEKGGRSVTSVENANGGAGNPSYEEQHSRIEGRKMGVIPKPPAFRTSQKGKKFKRFWMPYVSFLNAFEDVHVCRIFPEFHERFVEGQWNCLSAGGHVRQERWHVNPHFRLRLAKKAPCFIHLALQDRCFASDCNADLISFHIIKSPCFPLVCPEERDGEGRGEGVPPSKGSQPYEGTVIFSPNYYRADSLYFEGMLEAADDYWIIPSTFTEGLLDRFIFRISTPSTFIVSKESIQDNWCLHTVQSIAGSVGELEFGEVTAQISLSFSSSQTGDGLLKGANAKASSSTLDDLHSSSDRQASLIYSSAPSLPTHMNNAIGSRGKLTGTEGKGGEPGNSKQKGFFVIKASRRLLVKEDKETEKRGAPKSYEMTTENHKNEQEVPVGVVPRFNASDAQKAKEESNSHVLTPCQGEVQGDMYAEVASSEGEDVVDIHTSIPLSLLLLNVDDMKERRRSAGAVAETSVVACTPFRNGEFCYLQGTIESDHTYNVVCGIGCKLPEKMRAFQFHIWSSIPPSHVTPLPPWRWNVVNVHWGDSYTINGAPYEGSGPWDDATNNPQVEVSPVRAGECLVVRLTVSQFSDQTGMPPGITLFAIRNKERHGEGIQGLVPRDRIMARSSYVRRSWLEHVFYVDEDLDSLLLMPCLQPVGSKGNCRMEIYSEYEDVSVHSLSTSNMLL